MKNRGFKGRIWQNCVGEFFFVFHYILYKCIIDKIKVSPYKPAIPKKNANSFSRTELEATQLQKIGNKALSETQFFVQKLSSDSILWSRNAFFFFLHRGNRHFWVRNQNGFCIQIDSLQSLFFLQHFAPAKETDWLQLVVQSSSHVKKTGSQSSSCPKK